MHKTIVRLSNVGITYHSAQGETVAVRSLSFDVKEGEFVAIVGPSGCGKSTVLSMICGLYPASEGDIWLGDSIVTKPSPLVGYMLQHDHLFDWRTIEQNVMLGLEVRGEATKERRQQALNLLKTYGLYDFRKHYPRQLSGGMRQRIALIRTLAVEPDILLLDEPFSALDSQTRLAVSDIVGNIIKREKKTAILVTHDIAEAISMANRILVFSARPCTLKKEYTVPFGGTPIERRSHPDFKLLFNEIWKELDIRVE